MAEVSRAPEGTIAFVFTDIEGSTRLWDRFPDEMSVALRRHNEILQECFQAHSGWVFKGTGDGFCVAFDSPSDAVMACVDAQGKIGAACWPFPGGIRVRMAVHAGTAEKVGDDYFGPALNRTSRILDLGHGGQILISATCCGLAADRLAKSLQLVSLGKVELEGFIRAEEVLQVCAAGLPSDFPPLRVSRAPIRRRHNIEPDPRPFVGRISEREELTQRLLHGQERLITLTGIGGIGKTRLSKEAALAVCEHFPDGAWLIPCDTLRSRQEIAAATLAALGAEADGSHPEKVLLDHVESRNLLLLFDCFEGLLDEAELLSALLKKAPNLKCLVTSRAVLGLEWEYEFALGPLSVKKGVDGDPDGIALFEEAARHVQGAFRLNRRNRAAVGQLVKDLEGVPLAIVLAAGRLRHLSLEELRNQLSQSRLGVLKRRPVGGDRHANLQQVIGDSFALLEPEDLRLAAVLSVFEGGFMLEDALAVLEGWQDPMDGISRLRDHSLLTASPSRGHMRYRELDTVREYLVRASDEEDLAQTRLRHAQRFAVKAQEVRSLFEAGQWQAASAALWTEAGNFRAASKLALEGRQIDLVRTYAKSLARAYLEAGVTAEFEALVSAAEEIAAASKDFRLMAEVLGLRGEAARRRNDLNRAREYWTQREELGREAGDHAIEVDAMLDIADTGLQEGRLDIVYELLAKFDHREQKLPDGPLRASGLVLRAQLCIEEGNVEQASCLADQAKAIIEHKAVDALTFYVLRSLATVYRKSQRLDKSIEQGRRMLRETLDGNHAYLAARSLHELSLSFELSGRIEEAALAIGAASLMPRSVVLSLKDLAKRRRIAFEAEHGSGRIEDAVRNAGGGSWTDLADRIIGTAT